MRDLCRDAQTLLADQEVLELLRQWGREGKVCNMRVERLFAQIKHATPGKAPHLERYLAAGTLCQWLRDHRAGGGRDTKAPHSKDMCADGVPLVGARARGKHAHNRRSHLAFANDCVSQEKRRRRTSGDTPLTCADVAAIKRQAVEEYKALPAEEKRRFDAHGQGDRGLLEASPRSAWQGKDVLWGLASEPSVVDPELINALISERVGASAGASRYLEVFRKAFNDATFVKDAGPLSTSKPCVASSMIGSWCRGWCATLVT